jgi:flagellar basal body-associated protein FliL
MKKLKKRFTVPAVVFILSMCALIGLIYIVGKSQEQQNRTNAKLNAMTYAERINGELMEGIGVTDTLKQVVHLNLSLQLLLNEFHPPEV